MVPARGPAGWAGGRLGGGQVGVGVALRLRCCCPVRPSPPHTPAQTPALDRASEPLRPDGGEKGGRQGTTWEPWKGPEGMLYLRGLCPAEGDQRQNRGGRVWDKILESLETFFKCISFLYLFLLTVCVSVSDNRGSLCLSPLHILETSHFNEVGMKKLGGRLAGGLRGRGEPQV